MTLRINGPWSGWSGETVIELTDGTFWQQAEYLYEYRYAYRPAVELADGYMTVEGMSRAVRVGRVSASRSTINGAWRGWDGKMLVEEMSKPIRVRRLR